MAEPFAALARDYPGAEVYPPADFRLEWGPIFHRGRLDGSARLLVIGQDPAAHESIARRVLVGRAGQRAQGFIRKLGIARSYVIINAFVYSMYDQERARHHGDDPRLIAYRNRWLDALVVDSEVEAVLAFGGEAAEAWERWRETPAGRGYDLPFAHVRHPTQPESATKKHPWDLPEEMRRLLENWNRGLTALHPRITHPDALTELVPYDEGATEPELAAIPEADLPAGSPPWMRSLTPWARRGTDEQPDNPETTRATVVVTIPEDERPWHE